MCPGKHPIKIGANQPVSINIYFDNSASQANKNHHKQQEAADDINVQITDEGFLDNYDNRDNHPNNRINASHELMKAESLMRGQSRSDNKSSEAELQINLIESNRAIKNINRSDNIKHFIHIYHWVSNRQTDNKLSSRK